VVVRIVGLQFVVVTVGLLVVEWFGEGMLLVALLFVEGRMAVPLL